ncbi:MAG: CCA tRNA nucleotidyltransferase [Geminicoccaceae bacterium]|nr:CCA tRNA nucleotidyltransferase [Geminicoccaceae bacterium]
MLGANGREARFIGGCVRDTLLAPDLDEVDIDVATQERPESVMALLGEARIRVVPTGLGHGTVTAFLARRSYEITTLREDAACDGRHAEVRFTDDFVADAARRDFTINTLACDGDGRLFDPFGGAADLVVGLVRFVGDPERRVREDFLRILRFFRFHARFGQDGMDEAARDACRRLRAGLDAISAERKHQELFRLLALDRAAETLAVMQVDGILARLLGCPGDVERLRRLIEIAPESDPLLRLAALVRGRGAAGDLVDRLRLSRGEAHRLERLLASPLPALDADPPALRRAAARTGSGLLVDLLRLAAAGSGADALDLQAALGAVEGFEPPPFPLRGGDLMALGLEGPRLGAALAALREDWIEADFRPGRDDLLRRLPALPPG